MLKRKGRDVFLYIQLSGVEFDYFKCQRVYINR